MSEHDVAAKAGQQVQRLQRELAELRELYADRERDLEFECTTRLAVEAELNTLREATAAGQLALWTAWREAVADWHPLPARLHCLAYLATEAGEALDTGLRLVRVRDDRSHDRQRELGQELAQVVDMAYASALRYGIDLDAACRDWRDTVRARGNRATEG